jgi:hypothetical protein
MQACARLNREESVLVCGEEGRCRRGGVWCEGTRGQVELPGHAQGR